MDAIDAIVKCL